MIRQAWMRISPRCFNTSGFETLFFSALVAVCVMVSSSAFARADLDRNSLLGDSSLGLPESAATSDLSAGMLTSRAYDAADSGADIQHQPAPQVPAEMLTEPAETVESALPVPEPTSLALFGGLGGMLLLIHRMRAYFDHSAAV